MCLMRFLDHGNEPGPPQELGCYKSTSFQADHGKFDKHYKETFLTPILINVIVPWCLLLCFSMQEKHYQEYPELLLPDTWPDL